VKHAGVISLKPVQPGSALALVDSTGRIAVQSENLAAFCGLKRKPGRLGDLFDAASAAQVLAVEAANHLDPLSTRMTSGIMLRATVSRQAGNLLIELEPPCVDVESQLERLVQALDLLARARQVEGLADTGRLVCEAALVLAAGYERTLMCRLDADGHGEIVAEAGVRAGGGLVGRYYPASALPQNELRRFVLQQIRAVTDTHAEPIPLCGDDPVSCPVFEQHLDFPYPSRQEWLQRNGVRATLSATLMLGERVWGFLSLHSLSGPRAADPTLRKVYASFCREASRVLARALRRERYRRTQAADLRRRELLRVFRDQGTAALFGPDHGPELLRLVDADGCTLLGGEARHDVGLNPADCAAALTAPACEHHSAVLDVLDPRQWSSRTGPAITHALRARIDGPTSWTLFWWRSGRERVRHWVDPLQPTGVVTGAGFDGLERDVAAQFVDQLRFERVERTRIALENLVGVVADNPAAIVITDADVASPEGPRIVLVSDGFLQLSGHPREALIGRSPKMLQGPGTDRATTRRIGEALRRREVVQAEILNYSRLGRPYWIDLRISPIFDRDGQVTHFISVQTDITATREARRQLSEQNRGLTEALTRIEALQASRSRFLASISHEIRTPLAAILGHAELARRGQPEAAALLGALDSIDGSARHLLELVNGLLDASQLELGELKVHCEPVAWLPICAALASAMRPVAARKGLELRLEVVWPVPMQVVADPLRLRQALWNLVGNAIKFTSSGSVRLEVAYHEGALQFDVIDTGPGIPEGFEAELFKPFSQADSTRRRRIGGAGLGLYISRELVGRMGGELGLRHLPHRGACFSLRLQVAAGSGWQAAPAHDEGPRDRHAVPQLPALKGRVLLAEDDPVLSALGQRMLTDFGLQVTAVADGREAVARGVEPGWDAILLDMHMPELDGAAAAAALRKAGVRCPILAVTADLLADSQRQHLDAGCDAVLGKPFTVAELWHALAARLGAASDGVAPPAPPPALAEAALAEARASARQKLPADCRRLDELWTAGRQQELKALAHRLRGLSGMVGLEALHRALIRLDRVLSAGPAPRTLIEDVLEQAAQIDPDEPVVG
jgi:PAS domain S-box-containing protein